MKPKLPATELILYALALSQTLGWAYATILYDGDNPAAAVLSVIRNGLLGAAVSFGAALAAQKTPRILSKRARMLGYAALALLLIVSPVVIAPAVVVMLPARVIAWIGNGGAWVLAVAIATAPDAVAVAIAAQSGALQAQSEKGSADKQEIADAIRLALAEQQPAPAEPCYTCEDCGKECKTQHALNAHQRAHKPTPIDVSLLRRP